MGSRESCKGSIIKGGVQPVLEEIYSKELSDSHLTPP